MFEEFNTVDEKHEFVNKTFTLNKFKELNDV